MPEHDIFPRVPGHGPMHTGQAFPETPGRFGNAPHGGESCQEIRDEEAGVTSHPGSSRHGPLLLVTIGSADALRAACVFMQGAAQLVRVRAKACSRSAAARVELERVVNQTLKSDHYQPLLFIVD